MATIEVGEVGPVSPWRANLAYLKGASITPEDVNDPDVTLPQVWFVCIEAGTSGATPPDWPGGTGVLIRDNGVLWMSYGFYPN